MQLVLLDKHMKHIMFVPEPILENIRSNIVCYTVDEDQVYLMLVLSS